MALRSQLRVVVCRCPLALVFLLLVSLLVTTGLAVAGIFVSPYMPEGILHLVSLLVSFAVMAVLFAMMFKWLPDVSVAWGDVWLGALLTALFFELGKAANRDWNRHTEQRHQSLWC